jgi:hypothetical protein
VLPKLLGNAMFVRGTICRLKFWDIMMLQILPFCLKKLNFKLPIESANVIEGRIWNPKVDKPLVLLLVYLLQEGQHHLAMVSIKKQEGIANA